MPKITFLTSLLPCSKVQVKGQDQVSGTQQSILHVLGARFCLVQQRKSLAVHGVCQCVILYDSYNAVNPLLNLKQKLILSYTT